MCRQEVELIANHLPRHRLTNKSGIVAAFFDEGLPVPKNNLDAARHFFGKPLRIRGICRYGNPPKKSLNILAADPGQFILGWHDIAIQDCHSDNVWKAVIGLLLSGYGTPLVALFTAADDIECDIKGFNIDSFHVGRAKSMTLLE